MDTDEILEKNKKMLSEHCGSFETTLKDIWPPCINDTIKIVIRGLCGIVIPNFKACLCTQENGRICAAMLSVGLIDSFAGFYAGNTQDYGVGQRFDSFVDKYLNDYGFQSLGNTKGNTDLYLRVRNKLLHNFSEGLNDTVKTSLCIGWIPEGKDKISATQRKIYVSNLVDDVLTAIEAYLRDLKTNSDLQNKFTVHYGIYGFLGILEDTSSVTASTGMVSNGEDALSGRV